MIFFTRNDEVRIIIDRNEFTISKQLRMIIQQLRFVKNGQHFSFIAGILDDNSLFKYAIQHILCVWHTRNCRCCEFSQTWSQYVIRINSLSSKTLYKGILNHKMAGWEKNTVKRIWHTFTWMVDFFNNGCADSPCCNGIHFKHWLAKHGIFLK